MKRPLEIVTRVAALVACCLLVLGLRDTPRFRAQLAPASSPTPTSEQTARLCVNVAESAAEGVSGAHVRAIHERGDGRYAAFGEAVTDGSGRACLESLPLGMFWVLADAKGLARASKRVTLLENSQVDLVLERAVRLSVTVTDELGAPLPQATVLIRGKDSLPHGRLTDEHGLASFEHLPQAPWSVRAAAPGYEGADRNDVSKAVTIPLRRLAALDVRVVDSQGASVAGAEVLIAGSTLWPPRRAETNAQGLAKIRGLGAGSYDLRASHQRALSTTLMGFELARGAHEDITLRLVPGRMVNVVVTDGDEGSPPVVAGADVVLVEGGLGSFPLRARTGNDGKVTLGPIAPGPATLAARAADFVGGPLVAVPDPPLDSVRIPLVRGAVLRGEVVDSDGVPVDGAQIEVVGTDRYGLPIAETPLAANFRAQHFAWSLGGPPSMIPAGELGVMPGPVPPIPRLGMAALSDPSTGGIPFELPALTVDPWITRRGEFTAKPVTPGRVRVLVRHPEFVEGASDIVSLAPAGEARVRVVLLRGGRLEGRVVDERGYPVEGAEVSLLATRGTFARTSLTASDGAFAFAAVPAEVTLSAARTQDPARALARRQLNVPEGQSVEIELVLPAPREAVRFHVVDDTDRPIELAELRVSSLEPTAPLRTTLFTDTTGFAELADARGLPLRIWVEAPRYATLEESITEAPAEMRLVLDSGVLVIGRVTAVRGRFPATGAVVTLRAGSQRKSTMTDGDGSFRFSGVPAGRIELSVAHPDYAESAVASEVARTGRADRPFELPAIDLSEPGEVTGQIVDAHDRPVEGARVTLGVAPAYLPQGALPVGVALSDRAGHFALRGLAPGNVRLGAYAPGVGRGSVDGIRIDSGRNTQSVVIRLTEPDSDTEPFASGGVAITLGERRAEVVVVQVAPGSEAERGGLRAGDILATIDGARPASMADARTRLAGPAGSDVLLEVTRDGVVLRLRISREPVRR